MVSEDELSLLRKQMSTVRVPAHYNRVFKDECQFSFDTALSPDGLYINMNSWQAFGGEFVNIDSKKTGQQLYLHELWLKVPLSAEEKSKQEQAPEKLAIGGDSGFQVDSPSYNIDKHSELILLGSDVKVPLPCPELPELVINAVSAIQKHDSASKQDKVQVWEEQRPVSKYAVGLHQEPSTGRTIPSDPSQWACAETGVKENLWLNLSTGSIGSGRQNWDGSGGNGAALRHFEATGSKYPLVVKLGTITPHSADVFSYAPDENDMVEDPKLAEHLSHWGINMMAMQKTEKTMAEAEIEANKDFEWSHITESGKQLMSMSGPGYIGLKNLGNSCYMNSILQALWTLPQLQRRYVDAARQIYETAQDPSNDFPTQMAKVGVALTKGQTGASPPFTAAPMDTDLSPEAIASKDAAGQVSGAGTVLKADASASADNHNWVEPQAFKSLVGRGHADFSSGHQQDAREYFQYLLDVMSRAERTLMQRLGQPDQPATADAFGFELEDRIQCLESGRLSYKRSLTNVLAMDIPVDAATNKDELEDFQEREAKRAKLKSENASAYIQQDLAAGTPGQGEPITAGNGNNEVVLPKVPFSACLAKWAGEEVMADYYSAAAGHKTQAKRCSRIANFPPYLMLQMNRYYVTEQWVAKKLEVLVDVPEELDLEWLRGRGPQPEEQLQPEEQASSSQAASLDTLAAAAAGGGASGQQQAGLQPDPEIVNQLVGMGFSENGSKRAAVATQNRGAEGAMEWVLSHMEDANFNDPLSEPSQASTTAAEAPPAAADPEAVMMLVTMGFTDQQAAAALKACHGSLERSADWLFSHADDLDAAVASVNGAAVPQAAAPSTDAGPSKLDDGPGKYELVGIVSHMGRNTACGHYVCHLKKEGKWVIYNDEKVAVSENPPRDLAYMYLCRRKDIPEQ